MNQNQIASLYRQVSTRGRSPLGLVVKLYDTVLEDLRDAQEALRAGQVERRTGCLNHALLVMAELQSTLDHEHGGDVARRLSGFYNVTRALVLEANIHASQEKLKRLVDLYLPLRNAWHQADTGKVATSPEAADAAAPHHDPRGITGSQMPELQLVGAGVGADADSPRSNWSA